MGGVLQTSSGVMGLSPRLSSVWSVSLSVRRSVLVHTRMSGLLGAALRTSVTHLADTFVYDVFESAEKQICHCSPMSRCVCEAAVDARVGGGKQQNKR